jgi:hypothetical protein
VNGVEGLRPGRVESYEARTAELESLPFQMGEDLPRIAGLDGVGFDDGERQHRDESLGVRD